MNTENNKLIAEHLGMQKTNIGWYDFEENLKLSYTEDNTFDLLKFNTSWDWLMSAVKDCTNIIEEYGFESEERNYIEDEIFNLDYTLSEFLNNEIDSIYQRVVSFIKWYNENK